MNRGELGRWKHDPMTRYVIKELQELEELKIKELLSISVGNKNVENSYFYIKGRIDGIRDFLNFEIEEESDEYNV